MNEAIELKIDPSIETIYFRKSVQVKTGQFLKKQTILGYYSINNKSMNRKLGIEKGGRLSYLIPSQTDGCIYKRSAIYELDFTNENNAIKPHLKEHTAEDIVKDMDHVIVRVKNDRIFETHLFYYNSNDLAAYDKVISYMAKTDELLRNLLDKGNHIDSVIIAKLEPCDHKIIYNSICTECYETNLTTKSFLIFDQIPGLLTDTEHIENKIDNIKSNKKLIMILDLDNTVIHAQRLTDPNKLDYYEKGGCNLITLYHYDQYVLKIRPYLAEYIQELLNYYEIFVYTFGTRDYALAVLQQIDPEEKLLNRKRLITRDESKLDIKELDKILPAEFNDLLVIVDDTASVWVKHKSNLIMILPYFFFRNDERLNRKVFTEPNNEIEKDNNALISEDELFINKNDCYLHFLARHLRLINRIYYQFDGKLATAVF